MATAYRDIFQLACSIPRPKLDEGFLVYEALPDQQEHLKTAEQTALWASGLQLKSLVDSCVTDIECSLVAADAQAPAIEARPMLQDLARAKDEVARSLNAGSAEGDSMMVEAARALQVERLLAADSQLGVVTAEILLDQEEAACRLRIAALQQAVSEATSKLNTEKAAVEALRARVAEQKASRERAVQAQLAQLVGDSPA